MPKYKSISVQKVYDKVKGNELIMSYLPAFNDEEVEPKLALSREFMFNIINTLDPEFFPSAIQHEEEARVKAKGQGQPENLRVEIIPELFDLIQYGVAHRRAHGARALGALRRGANRRQRPVARREYTLEANLDPREP